MHVLWGCCKCCSVLLFDAGVVEVLHVLFWGVV